MTDRRQPAPRRLEHVEQPQLFGDPQPGRVNVRERVDRTLGGAATAAANMIEFYCAPNDNYRPANSRLWMNQSLCTTPPQAIRRDAA